MEQIHVGVPQFNEKILKSVERTLKRFEAHQPFERSSWEMVDDYNLYHRELSSISTMVAELTSLNLLFPFADPPPSTPSLSPSQTTSPTCTRAATSLMISTPRTTTSGVPCITPTPPQSCLLTSPLLSAPAPTTKPSARCPSLAVSSSGEFNVLSDVQKHPADSPTSHSVHPILRRLEEFADLPLVPALLATIHEQSSEDLMKYKLAPVCGSACLGV